MTVSSPKKVLWVIKVLGPGGAEQLLMNMAGAHDPSRVELHCAFLIRCDESFIADLEARGVQCHHIGGGGGLAMAALRVWRFLRQQRVDIVHVHSPLLGSVARVVARLQRGGHRPKVVATEHNMWSGFHPVTRWANRLTGRWDDAVFVVSDEARKTMRGAMGAKAETLVHGVPVAEIAAGRDREGVRHELGIPADALVVGSVASFTSQKDHANLLAAVRLLELDHGLTPTLLLVGFGPLETGIRVLAESLDLAGRAIFTGKRRDATRVMSALDAFVLASRWEGLPVVIMEALATGLPIVATEVGGVPSAIGSSEAAILVPPSDPSALAAALAKVLTDPARRDRMAQAATARAQHFDVGRVARRVEQLYADL